MLTPLKGVDGWTQPGGGGGGGGGGTYQPKPMAILAGMVESDPERHPKVQTSGGKVNFIVNILKEKEEVKASYAVQWSDCDIN